MVSNFALVVAIYLVLCTIVAAARECGTCKKMAKIVRGDTIARVWNSINAHSGSRGKWGEDLHPKAGKAAAGC